MEKKLFRASLRTFTVTVNLLGRVMWRWEDGMKNCASLASDVRNGTKVRYIFLHDNENWRERYPRTVSFPPPFFSLDCYFFICARISPPEEVVRAATAAASPGPVLRSPFFSPSSSFFLLSLPFLSLLPPFFYWGRVNQQQLGCWTRFRVMRSRNSCRRLRDTSSVDQQWRCDVKWWFPEVAGTWSSPNLTQKKGGELTCSLSLPFWSPTLSVLIPRACNCSKMPVNFFFIPLGLNKTVTVKVYPYVSVIKIQ